MSNVVMSIDPSADHPIAGDTVLYTAFNDAIFGGTVEESHQDDAPSLTWRFRIVGHEGLFNHSAEAWTSRVIQRPFAVEVVDTTGKSHAEIAAECGQENADWLADTTPAPLDPSKVKAGDTVTLTKGDTSVRGPVTGVSYAGGAEWDFRVGEESYRRTGRIGLWAVTAHQPAPEPEPEWEPGTSGTATVRTVPDIRVMRLDGVTQPWASATFFAPAGDVKGEGQNRHDDWQVTDFVPDERRPLPSLDELDEALEFAGDETMHRREHAAAMLQFLRGEVR